MLPSERDVILSWDWAACEHFTKSESHGLTPAVSRVTRPSSGLSGCGFEPSADLNLILMVGPRQLEGTSK